MSDITIYNSSQFIEAEWLKLVEKYFPDEDIELLKAGLFGYVNEIMAQEVKNNVYHRNFIYDEYLLNTASTSKSIYNFAKIYNVDVENATPSKLSAILSVRETDLPKEQITNRTISDNGNLEQSIISRKTIFSINGKEFLLPYDIQITFNRNITDHSKYVITSRYVVENNEDFPFLDINNSLLKSWDSVYNGERYIFIRVDLFQLKMRTKTALVSNENSLYNTFYKFSFEGQLSYFNVFYEKNGKVEKIKILNNNNYALLNGDKYCYYNLIDNNTLEISFSSLFNSFKPEFGSKLKVDIYTTLGSAGNLGSVTGLSVSYAINDYKNSTPLKLEPLTDCYGGKDKLSLLDLKKKIITKNLTRNAIITENDLNNFFNLINRSELINNSEIRFIKKRNDVLRKIYGAFILLRDTNNIIVPSRTLENLKISKTQLDELVKENFDNVTIPERSMVCYDIDADEYFLVTKELEYKKYLNNDKYLLYSIPYLLNLNTKKYFNAKYYKTYTNVDVNLEYRFINKDIPYKFMINSFNIVRNSLENEVYKLSLNFNTNLTLTETILKELKIRGVLKDRNGKAYGYFDFNRVDHRNLLYEAYLSSEKYDSINDDKLNIYNSLYLISTEPVLTPEGNTSLKNCYIEEGSSLEIQVLYKSDYSAYKYGEAANMPDLITNGGDSYSSACVFYNDTPIELFRNVTKYIDSNVIPDQNNGGIIVKSVPVIEYNYFRNNIVQMYRILDSFQKLLDGNMNRLESGMDIDIKFFNTHGKSKLLYTGFKTDNLTGKKDYKFLDRLDIDLNITVYLNTSINDSRKEEISMFLAKYIETLNKKEVIAVSNITRSLEDKFKEISFIEVNSINGDYYQKIVNVEYDKDSFIDFIPEYVNIRKSLSAIKSLDGTEEKKYNYDLTINYK